MIRLSVLWLAVIGVAVYSWKDWFKGLCGLVLLIGILEYPDVPRSMFGITGLNFFNLLLLNVTAAWLVGRSREKLEWDLPPHVVLLLTVYVGVILVGFARIFQHRGLMVDSTGSIFSEYLINTLKWIVPALILFDGCRTRERLQIAVFALLGAYTFLGLMVIKVMPLGSAFMSGDDLQHLALKLTQSRIGYHRVTLSMMLGGAIWALVASKPLFPVRRLRWAIPLVALVMVYAQALTGGRGGMVTLAILGMIFGALRYRKVFLVAPVVIVLMMIFVPSAIQRLTFGVDENPYNDQATLDKYELTSGRNVIWPYVIAEIKKKPLMGWGRQAMMRNGTVAFLHFELNEDFGHPHNAYLEQLLDNGIVGFVPVMALFLTLVFHSLRLFLDKRGVLCTSAGGVALALILGLMIAGMSSQSFYPVEGTFEMWAAIGLMLRVSVQRQKALAAERERARLGGPAAALHAGRSRIIDLDPLIFGDGPADAPVAVPVAVPGVQGAWRPQAAAAARARAAASPGAAAVRFRF